MKRTDMAVPSALTATSERPSGPQQTSATPPAKALRTTSSGFDVPCGHTLKLLSCEPAARYCCMPRALCAKAQGSEHLKTQYTPSELCVSCRTTMALLTGAVWS